MRWKFIIIGLPLLLNSCTFSNKFISMDGEPYELIRVIDTKYQEIAESLIDAECYNKTYGGTWV